MERFPDVVGVASGILPFGWQQRLAESSRSPLPAGPVLFCGQLPFLDRSLRTLQTGVVAEDADHPFDDRAVLVYPPGGPGISAVDTLLRDPPAVDSASSRASPGTVPRPPPSLTRASAPPTSIHAGTTESSTHDWVIPRIDNRTGWPTLRGRRVAVR